MSIKPIKTRKKQKIARARKKGRLNKVINKIENSYTVTEIELLFLKPCIYYLKCNDIIVYIGETISIMSRISQHINDNTKIFDSFTFELFEGTEKERKFEESKLINNIKPHYNIVHTKKKSIRLSF